MTETTIARGAPRSLLTFLRKGRAGGAASTGQPPSGRKARFWNVKRAIAVAMMLLIPLVGIFGATAANAKEDEGVMKFAFYKIASSTTAFFSTVQDPDSKINGFSDSWKSVLEDPGSAGSMLGYADPSFSSVSGWLASGLSGSSDAIGYDTLLIQREDDSGSTHASATYRGMVDYAYFGAALKGMGLDGTSTGLSLGFMNVFSGGVVMLLYILSGAVDFLFTSAISVLDFLNPFKLFYLGVAAINADFARGMVGGSTGDLGALSGLASWIGGWYRTLNAMSWAVLVPVFIGVLLFSLFMFKKMDRGGAVKKLMIRIAFIGLGLPLLGSMYTGMLSSMGDTSSSGNAGSTRAVMSTYVDFESWAMKSRLAIPDGAVVAWDAYAGQPTDQAQAKVRNTALAINNQSLGLRLTPIVSAGDYDASWSNKILQGMDNEDSSSLSTYSKTVDMLARFMNNSQVSAASFETAAKGSLTQSSYYKDNGETVKNWFESLDNDAQGLSDLDEGPESEKISPWHNPLIAVQKGSGLQGSYGAGGRQFTTGANSCYSYNALQIVGNGSGSPRACNLAPLAMYNYLNTDFGSKSMTMYSSQNAQSEATRSIHNSVNQVGTGTMSFLYWFNTVVLLGSFVLIGLGYGFSLIFSSIRRSFQIMTAVPFATLGALAAIAKVVVYSVALILEVVVTIFTYTIVQEFLISLPQIIEMPFAKVLNNGSTGALAGFVMFLTSGWAFGMVVTVLSIVGVVIFTIMAMRVRKMLVKAVEEAVTKLVEKFMDTQTGMPSGGKMAPALAGGLASGAGAAASNRMMNGGMGKGPARTPAPGTGNGNEKGGPAGIQTAGGTTNMGPGPDGGAGGQLQIEGGGQLDINESGAAGNGDPGSPAGEPAHGAAGGSASDEVALGRDVEVNGLSKPDSGNVRAPQVEDDVMSGASESVDQSVEGYKEADSKRLAAGTEGAKAVGHAGLAVGKGVAGDAAGAAESGGKAVESGGKAAAAGEEAKQKEADAGRSSLDKPDQRHAQKAMKAQQVSQAGGSVAKTAGLASATSGAGGKAAKAGEAAKAAKTVKAGEAAKATKAAKSGEAAKTVAPSGGQTRTSALSGTEGQASKQVTAPKSAPGGPVKAQPSTAASQSDQGRKVQAQHSAPSQSVSASGTQVGSNQRAAAGQSPTPSRTVGASQAPKPVGQSASRAPASQAPKQPTPASRPAPQPKQQGQAPKPVNKSATRAPASQVPKQQAPATRQAPQPRQQVQAPKPVSQSATRVPPSQVSAPAPRQQVSKSAPTQRLGQSPQPAASPKQAPAPRQAANPNRSPLASMDPKVDTRDDSRA